MIIFLFSIDFVYIYIYIVSVDASLDIDQVLYFLFYFYLDQMTKILFIVKVYIEIFMLSVCPHGTFALI